MGGIGTIRRAGAQLFLDFRQFKAMCSELIELQMTHVKQIFEEMFAFMLSHGHCNLVFSV